MNRDDIIRMAREAFLPYDYETRLPLYIPQLERFAALVAAAERERIYFETSSDFVKSAVAAEREACAALCEQMDHDGVMIAADCAEAIRARGNT